MINTPQLSMSIVMEEEIIDINVTLKQIERQRFSRTQLSGIALNFQKPGWVATSRLDHGLLT